MKEALHVVPAYGRRYATTESAEKAFVDGKDFEMINGDYAGRYMSIRDLERIKADGYPEVHVYTDHSLTLRTVHVL